MSKTKTPIPIPKTEPKKVGGGAEKRLEVLEAQNRLLQARNEVLENEIRVVMDAVAEVYEKALGGAAGD